MTDTLHELSAQDRAILTAFREHESPPPGAETRVYEAVSARLREDEPAAAAPVPWVRSIALSFAIAAAVLLAMRGVVTGAAALRERAQDTPAQAEHGLADTDTSGQARLAKPTKPTPATSAAAPASHDDPTDPAPAGPEAAIDEPQTEPDGARARAPRPRAATDTGAELAADLELLAQAKRTADPTPRLALLERHARTHPKSKLAEERDVLLIETLCALGRSADARARATSFAERHPGSAFNARVAKSCAKSGG